MNKEKETSEVTYKPVISISNQIILGCTAWTAKEFNLFCIFLSLIKKWDKTDVYSISVKEIMAISGKEWNYGDFTKSHEEKSTLPERVMTKAVTIFRDPEDYTVILPFNLLHYKEGIITFRITTEARPLLVELAGNFTQTNLDTILNLSTYPSKILYLAIKSKLHRSNFHLSFDVEDYKKFINVSKNTEPRRLKSAYIERPLKEIKNNMEVDVAYSMTKRGKCYDRVNFYPSLTLNKVWEEVTSCLQSQLSEKEYETWVAPIIPMSLRKHVVTLQVPSEYFRAYIEHNYIIQLGSALKQSVGDNVKLIYQIKKEAK